MTRDETGKSEDMWSDEYLGEDEKTVKTRHVLYISVRRHFMPDRIVNLRDTGDNSEINHPG